MKTNTLKNTTMKTKILLITIACFISGALYCQIIHVPADYNTIQEGINAASDGDTVLVAEATYFENINFSGKAITLASEFLMDGDTNHISNTIIDGSQPILPELGSVVTFDSGEDTTSVLCGFTITGGTGTLIYAGGGSYLKAGGGLFFNSSGGKLLNNYIENNVLNYPDFVTGGGISAGGEFGPQPWLVLYGNKISYNKSISSNNTANGGGMEIYCNLRMVDNRVIYNEANGANSALAAGVSIWGGFGHIKVIVTDNLVAHNQLISNSEITDFAQCGGLSLREDCEGIISGNTIIFNTTEVPNNKYCYGPGLMTWKINEDIVVKNNLIEYNSFTGLGCVGGGLCIWYGAGNYINNVIRNNYASHGGGVAIVNDTVNAIPIIINNTISSNVATDFGGGLYIYSADAVILNSIFWHNNSDSVECIFEESSDLFIQYSDIESEEVWPGEGNMNADPEFQEDGYHLDWTSTLVNQGISTALINGEYYEAPLYDIDGDERPFEWTFHDIGADEAQWFYVTVDESISVVNSTLNIFPNPFTTSTTIEYELTKPSTVQLTIYDYLGKQIEVIEKQQAQGKHQIIWNAEGLPAGGYFCVIKNNKGTQTTKLIKL